MNIFKITFLILLTTISLHAQQFEWGKAIGGSSTDNCQRIALDSSGNVFAAGLYTAPLGSLPSYGFQDIYLSKYASDGTLLWQIGIGSTNNDQVSAIATDTGGNILISGRFQGTFDFDPSDSVQSASSNPSNALEGFLARYNGETGALMEYRDLTSGGSIDIRSIRIDQYNDIFIGGQFSQTVDFDFGGGTYPQTSFQNSGDCFVGRYYGDLQLIWMNIIGSQTPAIDFISDICLGNDGFVYSTGMLGGTADILPGVGVFNLTAVSDAFLIRYSQNDGTLSWGFAIGGTSIDIGNSILVGDDGGIILAGSMNSSSMDVDPGFAINTLTKTGSNAAPFLVKYSQSGSLVNAGLLQGSQTLTSSISRIVKGPDNSFLVTGNYKGNIDLEPTALTYSISSGDSINAFTLRYMNDFTLMQYFEQGGNGDQTGSDILSQGTYVYQSGQISNTLLPLYPELDTTIQRAGSGLDGYLLKYNLITNTTGIPLAHDSHLIAYPNPSNGLVYFKNANNADVHVYDLSGREVKVGIQAETIDFGNVPEGLYTIVAIGKTGIQQARIFKY
jgi:hypothetical protein